MLTFFYFIILFILEGLAILKREIILFFIPFIAVIYFFENSLQKREIYLPKKASLLYLAFLIVSSIFYPFFVDKIKFVFHFFYYLGGYFVFILGVNEKKRLRRYLPKTLIIIGIIFSLLTFYFVKKPPNTALQFVYPSLPNHNHLGDFLGLVLLGTLFLNIKTKFKLFLIIFFGYFFILSFSRSAYVALVIVISILLIINRKKVLISRRLSFLLLSATIIFFIFSQKQLYQISFFKPVEIFLTNQLKYKPRDIFSGRTQYFTQAVKGFLEKPLTGWGLGNFTYISRKYVLNLKDHILSGFNLFLTILSEGGALAFLFFLAFFLVVLKKSNHHSIFFYLFLYQTVNFLTDYTYAIYTFFLLWFLLAGLNYQEESERLPDIFYPALSYLSLFFIVIYLAGEIFYFNGNYQWSIKVFPWQDKSYQQAINKLRDTDEEKAKKIAEKYYSVVSQSCDNLEFLGDFFQEKDQPQKALFFYSQCIKNTKFPQFSIVKKNYFLTRDLLGKNKAVSEFKDFYFLADRSNFWLKTEVSEFCQQEKISFCRFQYYYQPKPNTQEKTEKSFPYQATYTFNNDGLNERFNYAKKKPKDVFRIAVLGGGEAFGFLVNTKDNWVERLEDRLNLQKNFKHYEVINFAYHSYDLGYQVERFIRQAKDYQPDLIIWLNNDFYRLNEIFLPITEEKEALIRLNKEKEKYQKQGKYFPSWQLAYEEYEKKIEQLRLDVEQKQIEYLNEVFSSYKGPIIFISFYKPPEKIKTVLEKNTCYLYWPEFLEGEFQFAKTGGLNYQGQQKLAEKIFDYIKNNDLSLCSKRSVN